MRQCYQVFPNRHALLSELSWTHYRLIMRVEKPPARERYMNEAVSESIGGFDSPRLRSATIVQPPASVRGAFNRSLSAVTERSRSDQ